jgi:hypothetical protein
MKTVGIRLQEAEIEAFRAYAAKHGLKSPALALRKLALAALAREP